MATQRHVAKTDTKELMAALAQETGWLSCPLKKYNALLNTIQELRERIQDEKDARMIHDIDADPNQSWRSFKDVEAELVS